ncbi:MAG: SNF1-interacting protein [Piccolia ochrophora]|nr:MAG: SNF1-interacting protein [Piccolia ochrophora]
MGNSSTKEQRGLPSPSSPRSRNFRHGGIPSNSDLAGPSSSSPSHDRFPSSLYSSRGGRSSRPDISFLGIGGGSERDTPPLELRKETKQEREARRAERERVAREAERERSMRDEGVDGGYLVTQGVYTGIEDYSKPIVRQLMIERRLAPFFRGLNEMSPSWKEHQLIAAVRGEPIPNPEDIPSRDKEATGRASGPDLRSSEQQHIHTTTLPISSRSQSYNSDRSPSPTSPLPPSSLPNATSSFASSSSAANSPFRPRSKTLATLTTLSKTSPQGDMTPQEVRLTKDSYVNGQRIETYLYKEATECPICFLYYPPFLNKTRCCDQAICSECFVQIKRPDPHPPEHSDPASPTAVPDTAGPSEADGALVSEPAACPFCVQPEFGITYEPPPFRRGLAYANQPHGHSVANAASAMSSSTSLSSTSGAGNNSLLASTLAPRRRTTSISATAPSVITTDRVRPDWAQKLASARAHAARRSAAATALHTAAYLMGGGGGGDGRAFVGFGRRNRLVRATGVDGPSGGLGAPREPPTDSPEEQERSTTHAEAPGQTQRRSRIDDLEDMMMMEAIRLSLASEEERKKKDEKDAKKGAKKKDKENRKAEKAARKSLYRGTSNDSGSLLEGAISGQSSIASEAAPGEKGKSVDRIGPDSSPNPTLPSLHEPASPIKLPHMSSDDVLQGEDSSAQAHLARSRAQLTPTECGSGLQPSSPNTDPARPSHLRHVSNTSSSTSSLLESAPGSIRSGVHGQHSPFDVSSNASGVNIGPTASENGTGPSTPAAGSSVEPMFNFQSLAAMIDNEEKGEVNPQEVNSSPHADDSQLSHTPNHEVKVGHQDESSMGKGTANMVSMGEVESTTPP